jgi:predicted TIM-barrel fold metal-dependent hydrolase
MEEIFAGKTCMNVVGIKIYAGYYHFDINDPVYAPAYDFAEKHNLAVAIHSGDTYSERGKLIYSQPLSIDSLSVDRPEMRIIICHMGAPWLYDACEVAGKNRNVYMAMSGLYVGDAEYFKNAMQKPLLIDRYKQALIVMDNYDKVLFGTDWPLAPMGAYIDFCKKLVPPEAFGRVFYQNAARVYRVFG